MTAIYEVPHGFDRRKINDQQSRKKYKENICKGFIYAEI